VYYILEEEDTVELAHMHRRAHGGTGAGTRGSHRIIEDSSSESDDGELDGAEAVPDHTVTAPQAAAEEYVVDAIVDSRRTTAGDEEYRVRWEGYGADEDSWMLADDLKNAKQVLALYLARPTARRLCRRARADTDDEDLDKTTLLVGPE